MRAAKVQASLRIRAVSPEPSLLAYTSSESRGTFRQKARSLAPLNGWACAVEICHGGMFEDTNSLDAAHLRFWQFNNHPSTIQQIGFNAWSRQGHCRSHTNYMKLDEVSYKEPHRWPDEWLRLRVWRVTNRTTLSDIFSWHGSLKPHHDKTNKMSCAPSEDSDQPGHLPSLIRVFAVRSLGS